MKNAFVLFIIIVLTTTLSFSQDTYPKSSIIEGDTVILITPDQLKEINIQLATGQYYEELSSSLEEQVQTLDTINNNLTDALELQESQIVNLNKMLLIRSDEVQINSDLAEYYKQEVKKQKTRTWEWGVGGALLGALITLIFSK